MGEDWLWGLWELLALSWGGTRYAQERRGRKSRVAAANRVKQGGAGAAWQERSSARKGCSQNRFLRPRNACKKKFIFKEDHEGLLKAENDAIIKGCCDHKVKNPSFHL